MEPIQMQLSEIQKYLLNFFLYFQNLDKILNLFRKRRSLRGYLFLKL